MKVKEKSEKGGLKHNIQKTKIMASGPITSWEIDRETVETVSEFIFWGSKITADGDCSHEIKRRLLLGRKVMINLDNILKTIALTRQTLVGKVMSLLLNMLSRLVITFLPRGKRLLISKLINAKKCNGSWLPTKWKPECFQVTLSGLHFRRTILLSVWERRKRKGNDLLGDYC